jgi:hypothetical protein
MQNDHSPFALAAGGSAPSSPLSATDIEALHRICAKTGGCSRSHDPLHWIDAHRVGEILRTDEAAVVADCSAETIRRRCKTSAEHGRRIGLQIAESIWFVSTQRLLDWIEQNEGKPKRLAAETRLKKVIQTRLAPQEMASIVAAATRGDTLNNG